MKRKNPSHEARFSSSDDETAETPKVVVQHFYRHSEHYKDKVISSDFFSDRSEDELSKSEYRDFLSEVSALPILDQ